jgi:hypothetical protein
MGEGDCGSGLIYGMTSSGGCLSAFLFFFFLDFFFSEFFPVCGELSGLVFTKGSLLKAATCAGAPLGLLDG